MDELFNMIKNLPTLTLTSQEWDIFDDIVSGLKERSAAEFRKTWAELLVEYKQAVITSTSLDKLCEYLDAWLIMTNHLAKINHAIATFWQEQFKKPIIADELLDLTIELLPKNIYLLRLTLSAIEKAALIDSKNQAGFSLTLLHSAAHTRADQLDVQKNLLPPGEYAEKIKTAAIIFRQKQVVIHLQRFCETFLEYVCKRVEDILKDYDELSYSYYFVTERNGDTKKTVATILSDIENNVAMIKDPKIIQVNIKRFILLQDFLFTLRRPHYSYQEKLIEFSEKYNNFINYIRNTGENSGFSMKAIGDFFVAYNPFRSSKEDEFLKAVGEFIEKGKQYLLPEESNIQKAFSTR